MRTILLSFKADVHKRLVAGQKIYEHRKVFPNEPIVAYLYVSAPVKAITGIVLLGNRTELETWKEKYGYDTDAVKRIEEYQLHHKYVMEIQEFQNTNCITLDQLRKDLDSFVVPQMYYYIDGTPLKEYLENNLCFVGEKRLNDFSNISSNMICVH